MNNPKRLQQTMGKLLCKLGLHRIFRGYTSDYSGIIVPFWMCSRQCGAGDKDRNWQFLA